MKLTPILFEDNATDYVTQGIGALGDVLSGEVTEETNGQYEVRLTYPVTGRRYADLKNRRLIYCKPDPYRDAQPFRIYRITRPLNGIITIYARHKLYDLDGTPVNPFSASNALSAMKGLKANAAIETPYQFWTDINSNAQFSVSVPTSTRALLGGIKGSILDTYGGEYEWDNDAVKLYARRGSDNGVTISYGKNLTDIEQDENIANLCTGIIGYWANSDGELVQTPVVNGPGTYNFANVKAVDFSLDFEAKPTVEQLQKRAQQYVSDNNVGIPDVSITLSWVQLEQYSGYEGLSLLDRVSLGDTVTVRFPPLGIDVKARVVKTVYDILQDRYSSVEIGSVKANIADTIANNQQATNEQIKNTTSYLEDRIQQSTDLITNGGGYIYRKFDAAKNWVEIGSTDNLDLSQAAHVWRWNNGGFGHSGNGYNGPYRTAITQDGHIVADFIDAGTLTANIIRAGRLQDIKGLNFWDMETGEFRLAATATVNDQQIATKPETISGVDVEYASGISQTIPPTSGWSTTAPAWQDGRYIWQRTVTTLADGAKSISEPTCIQGAKGPQGPAGKDGENGMQGDGVSQIVEQYYLSTSSTTQTGGSWSTAQPKWQKGRYIWTRSMVTWTDGTTTYTDPVLAQAINGANQSASDAQQSVDDLDNSLNSEGVFNRLTDNGKIQGIYMSGGQLYINGSYIRAGTIDASQVNVTNLNADNIKSGTITGRAISGGTITGTTITGSSVRSTSNSGSVQVYQGHVSLYDPSGNTLLDIVPGGNNNPANLNFFLPGFGYVGAISCQNDKGLGRIVVNCANNGFFTTNRIQTQEIAVSGSGLYVSSIYYNGNNDLMMYRSGGNSGFNVVRAGGLTDKNGKYHGLVWVYDSNLGRDVLAAE